jgi:superfamily II DNA or RNA helicase
MDEGVDCPSFNALIMSTAMKKYRRTVQRVGRGMRPKQDDNSVYIFDFVDSMHPGLLEHSEYRIQTYQLEMFDMTGDLSVTSDRMKIPLTAEDGLYTWAEERRERTHVHRSRSYKVA